MEKVIRRYSLSPIEFYKFQLNQSINWPFQNLNETDITILAYIHLYKENAKRQIVSDRILTSMSSCHNYFGKLKQMEYIVKIGDEYSLNPAIAIISEDFIQVLEVKLDKENSKVNHPYFQR